MYNVIIDDDDINATFFDDENDAYNYVKNAFDNGARTANVYDIIYRDDGERYFVRVYSIKYDAYNDITNTYETVIFSESFNDTY